MSVSNPNICRTDTLMSGSGAVSVTAVIAPPCEKPGNLPAYTYDPRDGRMPLVQRQKSPDSGQVHLASLRGRDQTSPATTPGCDSTRSKSALSHEFGPPRHAASARRGRIASGGSHVGCQFNRKPMRDGSREDGSTPNLSGRYH